MRFGDFLDFKRGPEALVRFALFPLLVLVIGSLLIPLLSRLNSGEFLAAVLFLMLVSPLAYVIRERRQGRRQEPRARRGAERTPLPPQEEDE